MQCAMCKNGELRAGTTAVMLKENETIVVFKDVPALICTQCGADYTDRDVTRSLFEAFAEEAKRGPRQAFIPCISSHSTVPRAALAGAKDEKENGGPP